MIGRIVAGAILLTSFASCSAVTDSGSPIEQVWQSGRSISDTFVIVTRGAVDEDRFYTLRERVGNERALVAYDRRSGRESWRQLITGPCSPPLVSAGRVYCPGAKLFAFDASTGRPLWDAAAPSTMQLTEGAADAMRVYVGTSGANPGAVGAALAFSANDGSELWNQTFSNDEWQSVWVRSLTLSPEGDLLVAMEADYMQYVIFSAAVIIALDPATGQERWRYVDGDRTTNRAIGGLTLWEDLMMYSDPTGQEAVAVKRTTQQVVWRAPFAPNAFSTIRPPLVKDGVAYFTDTQGNVFAVDARTGRQRWRTKRPYGFLSHEVCGGIVFGNDQLGDVLDRMTGKPLGRPLGEDDTVGQAAVADDVLYLSAESGVYAFDCSRLPK